MHKKIAELALGKDMKLNQLLNNFIRVWSAFENTEDLFSHLNLLFFLEFWWVKLIRDQNKI